MGEFEAERELSLNFDEYEEKLANSSLSVSFSQSPRPSIMFESPPTPSWSIDVGFAARRRRCLFEFVAVLEALTFMAVVTAQFSAFFFFSESGDCCRRAATLSRTFETKSSPDVLLEVEEDDDDEHDEELDSSESS